jgi:hypothetical protein
MKIWFVCKIKYQKEDEKGGFKNITEPYLVDAVSFTDAEARIYEEMGQVIRGEFYVTNISKSNIVDVFHYDDADTWYKVKISYSVTEESGKEKKISNVMIVTAHDARMAYDRIYESLNNMLVSFEVVEIVKSPLVEVFPYIPDEEKEVKIPDNLKPLSEVVQE